MTALTHAATAAERRALPITVIGTGRLGAALAGALAVAGYTDLTLASRDPPRAADVAAALGVHARTTAEAVERAALVFLAVPDGAIEDVASSLAWRAGQGVVHTSGARGLDALADATVHGALAGCLHPLQTFPATGTPSASAAAALFAGIVCGVEAAPPLDGLLTALVEDLGARTVRLDGVDRARYHAAAVLVSNDVVALMAAATRTWTAAGLEAGAAQAALAPLMRAAAANATSLPLAQALTGPIARGDHATVARHVAALAGEPGLLEIYRALGRELLRLDLGHSPAVRAALEDTLR